MTKYENPRVKKISINLRPEKKIFIHPLFAILISFRSNLVSGPGVYLPKFLQSGHLIILWQSGFGSNLHLLIILGPGAGLACVFPFRWSGRNYTSCTEWIWAGQNLGNLWCSTKQVLFIQFNKQVLFIQFNKQVLFIQFNKKVLFIQFNKQVPFIQFNKQVLFNLGADFKNNQTIKQLNNFYLDQQEGRNKTLFASYWSKQNFLLVWLFDCFLNPLPVNTFYQVTLCFIVFYHES